MGKNLQAEHHLRFERLVTECLDPLYRTAYRLSGSSAQAEDLTQEAFLRARRAIAQLSQDANTRAWLFRILRNTWIDQIRKSNHEPHLLPPEVIEEGIAEPPAPSFNVMDEESRRRLEQSLDDEVLTAIQTLPDDLRLALLFQTFGGLSYEEISQALECPIGTVMSRLHRAKTRLRERLVRYAAVHYGVGPETLGRGGNRNAQA